jgi:hypothetical protein
MCNRKIRYGSILPSLSQNYVKIDGKAIETSTSIPFYLTNILGVKSNFKFARRPFAGATKLVFKRYGFLAFEAFDVPLHFSTHFPWLCADECYTILGVGKKTMQFSLWVKKNDVES